LSTVFLGVSPAYSIEFISYFIKYINIYIIKYICRRLLVREIQPSYTRENIDTTKYLRAYGSNLVYGQKNLLSPVISTLGTVDTFVYVVYASTRYLFSWSEFPPPVILLVPAFL